MSEIKEIRTAYNSDNVITVYDLDKDGDLNIEFEAQDVYVDMFLTPLEVGELIEILKAKLGEE